MTVEFKVSEITAGSVGVLICCILGAHVLDRPFFWWLPSSSVFLLVGVFVGAMLRIYDKGSTDGDPFVSFDPRIFFNFLLPPIIFHAGLGLMKKDFFQNIGTIVVLAVVGTIFSLVVIVLYLRIFQSNIALLPAALFAVLISAVDPVAVLALFEKYSSNCDRVVYTIILGESLLNDAVCVVLFDFLKDFKTDHSLGKSFGKFIYLSLISPLLGVAFGALTSLVFKHVNLHRHVPIEIALVVMLGAYLPYLLAELASLSAIVTIFVCGIMANHYTLRNLSARTRDGLIAVSGTMAMIAEIMVFLYIGVGVIGASHLQYEPVFAVHVIISCLLGRAANSFILIPLCNLRRKTKITPKQMVAVWYAGLRGAIAFALSSEMAKIYNDNKYVSASLVVVVFTTVVLGGFADFLYRRMRMIGISRVTVHGEPLSSEGPDAGFRSLPKVAKLRAVHKNWHNLDNNILKPFLCAPMSQELDRDALASQISLVAHVYDNSDSSNPMHDHISRPLHRLDNNLAEPLSETELSSIHN